MTATIEVNGAQIAYEAHGDPTKPPAVFVHGMCGDARVWADQQRRLEPDVYTVAYDRRGHSRSELGPTSAPTVGQHAADAAGLIEALGLAPCLLVGSSGGAVVAVEVARSYPRLLRGVAMSEPPLFSLDSEAGAALRAEIGAAVSSAADRRAAVDAFFEALCPGLWSGIGEPAKDVYRDNAAMLFAEFDAEPYRPTRADIAAIEVPALVLSGTTSHQSLRVIAQLLTRLVPDCRFVSIEGSGHVTYAERPADFAAAIRSFALELSPSLAG